jgi:hypothetical protein
MRQFMAMICIITLPLASCEGFHINEIKMDAYGVNTEMDFSKNPINPIPTK